MPLSQASDRSPLHTRSLTFQGYERSDGLFDIEGHLVDTKPFDMPNKDRGGCIKQGEPLHEMRIRLTIDDNMLIHNAEAITEWAPFHYCQGSADTFKRLVGESIGPGWNSRVRDLLGGTQGCTHITEMLAQLATTAYQSMFSARYNDGKPDGETKPAILDTCYALATDGPVVEEHWPKFYQPHKP